MALFDELIKRLVGEGEPQSGPTIGPRSHMERAQEIAQDAKLDPQNYRVMGDMPSGPFGAVAAVSPTMIKGLKARGGETLKKALDNPAFSQDIKVALMEAQRRFPRTFGHLTEVVPMKTGIIRKIAPGLGDTGYNISAARNLIDRLIPGRSKLSKIEINPYLKGHEAFDTVAHELTHGAQRIMRNDDLRRSYGHLDKIVGYANNPWETSPRIAGAKFSKGVPRVIPVRIPEEEE